MSGTFVRDGILLRLQYTIEVLNDDKWKPYAAGYTFSDAMILLNLLRSSGEIKDNQRVRLIEQLQKGSRQ